MQDVDYLESRIDDHERELTELRRSIQAESHARERFQTEDFVRRARAIGQEPRRTTAVTVKQPSRRIPRLRRHVSRDRIGGVESSDLIQRNTAAFERSIEASNRLAKVADRQAAVLDRHTAVLDRQAEAFDRQAKAFDRQAEAFDRHMERLDRLTKAVEQQVAAVNRQRDALIDLTVQIKHLGTVIENRTNAVMDSFAQLARDVRGGERPGPAAG